MTFDPWESLLEAARAGADWAWSDLYQTYAPKVRGYAASQGAADPDDLLGEVFLQAVRNLNSFVGDEAAFRAWLFTIVHRRVLDSRRRARRRPEDLNGHLPKAETAPAAEEVALGGLAGRDLQAGFAVLTVEQQRVLALRVIGDLSLDDVARILNKRTGAIKALQHRALQRLRKVLDESVSK
ncbi:MAG: RNA polymerase sigma factor [Acidimicrobiia bacterium]